MEIKMSDGDGEAVMEKNHIKTAQQNQNPS